jgi:Holliday junction resolvase RusA-like endonuclease
VIVFESIPIPPSSNHQYVSFVRHGRVIHVKSPELVKWRKEFDAWVILNINGVRAARSFVNGKLLNVHVDIYWPYEKLFTKQGKPKKLDVSNRLKALHDALADALEIDDCVFWGVSVSKQEGLGSVSVSITHHD